MPESRPFVLPTLPTADMSTSDQLKITLVQATAMIVAAAVENGALSDTTAPNMTAKKDALKDIVDAVRTALEPSSP